MARRPSDALRPALAKYGEQLRKSPERMERDVLDLMKNNGSRLDNFTLTAYAGERKVKLSDYRGRVVLLTLWYPSCSSCREDLPYMQKTLEKYGPRGFSVITINARPWEDALATIQMRRFGFESLRVPYTDWAEMRFWIRTYPQHMLLDREGRVLFVPAFWGFEPRHDFELALEMLLDAGNR
jgi:peroxiredoxin